MADGNVCCKSGKIDIVCERERCEWWYYGMFPVGHPNCDSKCDYADYLEAKYGVRMERDIEYDD